MKVQARKSVRYVDELSNILKSQDGSTDKPESSVDDLKSVPITKSNGMLSKDLNELKDLFGGADDDDEEEDFPVLSLSASSTSTSPPGPPTHSLASQKLDRANRKNAFALPSSSSMPQKSRKEERPIIHSPPPPPSADAISQGTTVLPSVEKLPVVVAHRKSSSSSSRRHISNDSSGSNEGRGVSCDVPRRSSVDKKTVHAESLPPQELSQPLCDSKHTKSSHSQQAESSISSSSNNSNSNSNSNSESEVDQLKYFDVINKDELEEEDDDDVETRAIRETRGMLQESILKAYRTIDDVKGRKDSEICKALKGLSAAVIEYSVVKEGAFQQVGLGPIVDLLRSTPPTNVTLLLSVFTTVNKIIENSKAMQTLLGFSGGIYLVGSFVNTKSLELLERIIAFYEQLFQDSPILFFTCGGVANLVSLLRGACGNQLHSSSVLQLILLSLREEKKTPLCDIAKTYVREDLFTVLCAAAKALKGNPGVLKILAEIICELATADAPVKRAMSQRGLVNPLLELFSYGNQEITLAAARTVEALTFDEECIDNLIAEGTIKVLMDILANATPSLSSSSPPPPPQSSLLTLEQCALSAISNISRLKSSCQGELVKAGIVPVLVKATEMQGVRDVAIPLLCSLIKTAPKREPFAKGKVIETLVHLLTEPIYSLNALETISWWLRVDPPTIKSKLSHTKEIRILAKSFECAEEGVWQMLLTPLLLIIKQSHTIAQKLGEQPELMDTIVKRLETGSTVQIRLLLDMLEELFVKTKDKKAKKELVTRYNLVNVLDEVSKQNSEKIVITLKIASLLKILQSV